MGETTVSDIAVQRDDIEDNALLQKSEWENVVWENAVLGNSAGRTLWGRTLWRRIMCGRML